MSDCQTAIEKAKKEQAWTAYVMTDKGKHYLHSRLYPSREKGIEFEQEGSAIILSFGLGLGYHWQKGKWPKQTREVHILAEDWCFVQEKLALVAEILGRTATKMGESDTPILFEAEGEAPLYIHDNNRASSSLTSILKPQKESPKGKAVFHYFQPAVRLAPERVPDLSELYKRSLAQGQSSATKEHFAFVWHNHFTINLQQSSSRSGWPILHQAQPPWPDDQKGAVFVAGASPGLNTTLADPHNRRQIQQKAIVIASDSAEAVLRGYGLEPDIVVAIDASPFSANQLAFTPPRNQTIRLTNPVVTPALFDQSDLVLLRHHPLEQLLVQFLGIEPLFLPGNHVGSVALELGRALRPQEIWIAGMDLSFARGVTYGQPSMYHSLFLRRQKRLSSLESQAMEQIQRSFAYALPLSENPGGELLYRRHSLDQGLAELKESLMARHESSEATQIYFCHLPAPIARELNQPSWSQIDIQTPPRISASRIHSSFVTHQVQGDTLNEFLRNLDQWFQTKELQGPLLQHWPEDQRHQLLLERLQAKQRIWSS